MTDPDQLAELEEILSEVALVLFAPRTVDGVLQRIVDEAKETVEGCDQAALGPRELIGQAQGILMERERITPTEVFRVLVRASQHLK